MMEKSLTRSFTKVRTQACAGSSYDPVPRDSIDFMSHTAFSRSHLRASLLSTKQRWDRTVPTLVLQTTVIQLYR